MVRSGPIPFNCSGRLLLAALPLLLLRGPAAAADPSVQFANIAPLPGAGIALGPEGKPDGDGALQINIPVAYTPGADTFSLSVYGGGYIDQFNPKLQNGTAVFSAGFGGWPRVFISAMQLSRLLLTDSKALSAQVQVVRESSRTPAVAVGGQDLLNKERELGAARGFYAVATKSVHFRGGGLHLTIGYGTGRFLDHPFAGISAPLGDKFSAAVEYDGFQFNEGIAFRPGGRFGSVTMLAGYNDRCGLILGAGGAGNMPTVLQLAIGAALIAMREN